MYYENTTKRYTDRMNVGVAEFVHWLPPHCIYMLITLKDDPNHTNMIYIYLLTGLYIHMKQEAGTRQDKSLLNSKTYHIKYIILD